MGGKSKSTTVGYHYRPAFHVGLVGRPIDAFLEYRAADKTAWAGELTASGRIQIDAPDLFGGEKDQGGIVGPVDVMFGEPDQLPNPYLVEVFGNQTVAWRGMTTLAFCGGRLGAMNPYQQKSAYKIRKIKAGWDGDWGEDLCWYPETAEIAVTNTSTTQILAFDDVWKYKEEPPSSSADYSAPDFDDSNWPQGPGGFGNYGPGFGTPPANTIIFGGRVPTTPHNVVWIRKWIGAVPYGAHLFIDVWKDDQATLWVNGEQVPLVQDPDDWFHMYAAIPSARLAAANQVTIRVEDSAGGGNPTYIYAAMAMSAVRPALTGINPAHALYYVRTDGEKGREPVANINDASLRAAADRLFSEGFGLCMEYDPASDTPDAFQERICRIIGGSFERSLVDGQWYLDLARGDYDLESLPIMGDDDILEFKKQPTTLHGVTNSISVRYFDPERKEAIITPAVRALGLIRAFGEIHETLDFHEIPDADTALLVADRELRARITPSQAFEVVTRPRLELLGLRRNQYFRLQSPKRGIADMVCIVGEKDVGTLRSGAIRWKVAEDIYGYPDTTYIESEDGVDPRPPQTPLAISHAEVFEAPYVEVAAAMPRAELEALPPDVGFLLAVAAPPGVGLDYALYVKAAGGDYEMAANGEWCPTATAAVAVEAEPGPTLVPLANLVRLHDVPIGSPVLWDGEICRLDAKDISAPSVTLGRGCADTYPVPHLEGSRLWFFAEQATTDANEYTEGEGITAKVVTSAGGQQYPLAAATPLPLIFVGRQARPYPPAGVLINGVREPSNLFGELVVTWHHRDRVGQADVLIDATLPSIGPEAGTTYTMHTYLGDDLIDTQEGLEGTSATVSPGRDGVVRIELSAHRDGLVSLLTYKHTIAYSVSPAPVRITEDGQVRITEGGVRRIQE